MSAPTTAPAPGTAVRYHGSVTKAHGPAVVVGPCDCLPCWESWSHDPRFELVSHVTGGTLHHARPGSFT